MTARFLLHLREWEDQSTNMSEISCEGRGTVMNFKKNTVRDENFDHSRGWTIHDEFGNDPVLEARMGYGINVNVDVISGVGSRNTRVGGHERELCAASSSTSMQGRQYEPEA